MTGESSARWCPISWLPHHFRIAFTELHDVLPDGTLLGVMLPGGTSPIEGFISSNGGCESLGAGVYVEGINAKGTIVGQLFGPAGGGPFVWQR